MAKKTKPKDEVEIEPGAGERLAGILKKALNTPPQRTTKTATRQGRQGKKKG